MDNQITIICCECKKFIGTKSAEGGKGGISHGYCPECLDAWRREQLAEIEDMKKAAALGSLEGGMAL